MSFSTTRQRAVLSAGGGKSMADMFGGRFDTGRKVSRFQFGAVALPNRIASPKNVGTLWGNGATANSSTSVRGHSNRLA